MVDQATKAVRDVADQDKSLAVFIAQGLEFLFYEDCNSRSELEYNSMNNYFALILPSQEIPLAIHEPP